MRRLIDQLAQALHPLAPESEEHEGAPCDEQISENFSEEDAEGTDRQVGPHETEGDADRRADDRQKSEKAHPCSPCPHEPLRTVEFGLVDMEITLDPFHLAQMTYIIVEHAPCPVADGGINQQRHRFQSGADESHHHHLTAERKETACYNGRYEHTCVTVTDKKLEEGIHTL